MTKTWQPGQINAQEMESCPNGNNVQCRRSITSTYWEMDNKNQQWEHWWVENAAYVKEGEGWRRYKVLETKHNKIIYNSEATFVQEKPSGGVPIMDMQIEEDHVTSTSP
eukprot:12201403-Ditylum_brightwellii.AAC.1